MTAPDPTAPTAEDVIAEALLSEGAAPGSSLHSWRCEYPDRYGPCTCVAEVAAEVVAAIRAMSADNIAELIRGHVERDYLPLSDRMEARVVGPWRVEP